MKYYLLKSVWEPEILGVNNGVTQVEMEESNPITEKLVDFFMSSRYWEEKRTVPNFEVSNCTARLLKKAKLTDFLYFSPSLMTCPFMISEHVADVFSKFKIQKYYLYPVTLYDRGNELNEKYYLFCCPVLGYEYINFSDSIFYEGNDLLGRKYVPFANVEEFKTHRTFTTLKQLSLNSNFDTSLDFFKARLGGMHVSEALKDAIEILGFTGVKVSDKEPFVVTANK